jgi:hypothetical protein
MSRSDQIDEIEQQLRQLKLSSQDVPTKREHEKDLRTKMKDLQKKVSVLLTATLQPQVGGAAGLRRLDSGCPSAGREFSDSIDRKVGQAREDRAEVVADR